MNTVQALDLLHRLGTIDTELAAGAGRRPLGRLMEQRHGLLQQLLLCSEPTLRHPSVQAALQQLTRRQAALQSELEGRASRVARRLSRVRERLSALTGYGPKTSMPASYLDVRS